jgi:hypothetical protein
MCYARYNISAGVNPPASGSRHVHLAHSTTGTGLGTAGEFETGTGGELYDPYKFQGRLWCRS